MDTFTSTIYLDESEDGEYVHITQYDKDNEFVGAVCLARQVAIDLADQILDMLELDDVEIPYV